MADENIVTNIVAKSDFSNLISDLNKVSFSLTKLQDQLVATNKTLAAQVGVMNRSFADTIRSTGQYSTHFVSLTSDVDKFGMQLDRGQLKLSKFFQVYSQHAKTNGGLVRDLARQQVQLQSAILQPLGKNAEGLMQYNVHIPRGLDLVKNKAAIARQELMIMNKVVQEGANQLINWGKNTQWAGRQLTVGLTVPLAAFGKASADAFRQADEQLVRLTKVYGGVAQVSAQELGKVREDVSRTAADLARSYGASFKDTLALAADIAATGKEGNELLGAIKETTRLSVLGEVDRQEAMKATLAIQTAFKQNTDELSESINFLNAVENQTSTTLNDLVEAIPKAGPIIKGLGGSVQDLALYLTAMREGGINATESANALKSALASLINPTNVAVAKFQGFGIDLLGIVSKNAGNVTETLLSLQSALDKLDPLQKQQAIEQLFGKFQFARLSALFENLGRQGSQTLQVLDLMKSSSQELGDLASRELTQVTESASGKYRRAVEGLRADLAGIGDQFLRINTSLINFVDGIIEFVKKLPDPIKQALGFMGMLTAAAGPLIMLTGVLGNFFGYIIKGAYHFKALFKGGEGWKLLTPEILAAQKAGNLVEQTFYSDAKAAAILKQSINELALSYDNLAQKASMASMTTNPTVSTVGGSTIIAGRVVNPSSPYVGREGTRAAGHHIPRSQMTEASRLAQTVHSFTPLPIPLNQKIGAAPQIFTEGELPRIPGLTTSGGVSTGIVAGEAAKWHSLMGTLSMMTKREVADLKKEIARTGTFSTEINTTFGQLLPAMTKLTSNAAQESAAIVAQLQAGKMTVEAARAKIIAINAQLETMMAQTTTQVAADLGRTANLTQVPLINQPIVSPTGKANIKEIFRPNRPASKVIDKIARALGVRTWGGGYSTETTMPKRMNMGGNVVPGPNINADVVPALLTPGEFVVNREATRANLPLLTAINNGMGSGGPGYNDGGMMQLQSAHLMRSYQLLEDPSIQKALIGAGQDPKRLTSLTFQGYGQGTTAAIPRQVNSLMAQTWQGSNKERSIRIAENMKLPRHLRGDIIPLTNADALAVSKFYKAVDLPAVSSFFSTGNYQENLIKRIAIANAKSRGVSSTTDFSKFYKEELLRTQRAFSRGATHEAIKRGLINEFIVDPKTGQFRPDALSKAYTTNVSRQRVRVSTNTSVPYRINRGSEEYSARQAARFGGGRWSNILPLASRVLSRGRIKMNAGGMVSMPPALPIPPQNGKYNMGGIVKGYNRGGIADLSTVGTLNDPKGIINYNVGKPGYNMGGMVPKRYAMGGMVGTMLGSTAGYMGGSALGSMLGGNMGSMIGGMAGMMAIPAIMSGSGRAADDATPKVGKFKSALTALTALPGPVKAIGALIAIGTVIKNINDRVNEHRKIINLAFAPTEESAQRLGIKYNSLTEQLKEFSEQTKLSKANIEEYYAATQNSGVPGLNLTIKQLKELKTTVEKDFPDYVKMFNIAKPDEVISKAQQLKAQLVSGGMGAEEATKKIFAMISVSNKANQSILAIANQGFVAIKDKSTAASQSIKTFNDLLRQGNTDQLSTSFESVISAIQAAEKALIGTKDAQGKVVSEAEAFDQILESVKNKQLGTVKLTQQGVDALSKENAILALILNKTDTIEGAYSKIKLYLSGIDLDLKSMNSEMATLAARTVNLATQSLMGVDGKYGSIVSKIKELNERSSSQSVVKTQKNVQDNLDNQIKKHQKIIDQIKEQADERIKGLERQNELEDFNVQIKRLQLDYQDAIASGDMSGAAQAQLSIQALSRDRQKDLAIDAIRDKEKADIKAQEAIIERLKSKIDVSQKAVEKATESADASLKKAADLQVTLNKLISATLDASNGLDELEKKQLKNLQTELKSLGFGDIADKIGMGPSVPFKEGFMPAEPSGLENISKSVFEKVINSSNELKTSDSALLNYFTKGPKFGQTSVSPSTITLNKGTQYESTSQFVQGAELARAGIKPGRAGYVGSTFVGADGKTYEVVADAGRYGLSVRLKKAMGGYVKNYEMGGRVLGAGTSMSDSIPAMLSNGEYVVRASAVQSIGVPMLDQINKMAMGGLAARYDVSKKMSMPQNAMGYNRGGPINYYNVGGLAVNAAAGQSPMEIARMTMSMMNSVSTMKAKEAGLPKVVGRGNSL
jgi:TP901 family phage tail tape measure protein